MSSQYFHNYMREKVKGAKWLHKLSSPINLKTELKTNQKLPVNELKWVLNILFEEKYEFSRSRERKRWNLLGMLKVREQVKNGINRQIPVPTDFLVDIHGVGWGELGKKFSFETLLGSWWPLFCLVFDFVGGWINSTNNLSRKIDLSAVF